MISLHVDVRIDPATREAFLEAIRSQARATIDGEPGCLQFDVIEDLAEPNHFMFDEVYRDEAALAAHKAAPHFADWAKARDAYVRHQLNTVGAHLLSFASGSGTDPAPMTSEPP